ELEPVRDHEARNHRPHTQSCCAPWIEASPAAQTQHGEIAGENAHHDQIADWTEPEESQLHRRNVGIRKHASLVVHWAWHRRKGTPCIVSVCSLPSPSRPCLPPPRHMHKARPKRPAWSRAEASPSPAGQARSTPTRSGKGRRSTTPSSRPKARASTS